MSLMRLHLLAAVLALATATAAQAATPTWTTLTSSGNPTLVGQAVTFTATVKVVGGGRPPTGTVVFKDTATVLGTVTLDGTGKATLTTSALALGTHAITATYSGDANFSTSTSEALSQSTPNAGACSVPSFYEGTTTFVGLPLAVGDLNQDGKLDLVVAEFTGGDVRVVLGDGAGAFLAPGVAVPLKASSYAQPFGAAAPLADFNLDGKLDVAVPTGSGVAVLLGDGNGGLSVAPGSPVSTTLHFDLSLAVADFNLDGKPDVVIAANIPSAGNRFEGRATAYLGDGTGRLTASGVELALGDSPTFAVADFNRDGKPDIAVSAGLTTPRTFNVFLGDGNAGFVSGPESSPGDAFASGPTLGDFNLDGKTDIAGYRSRNVWVLVGDGTGAFTARASAYENAILGPIVVGDFNLDGKPDMISGGGMLLGDGVLAPGTSGFNLGPWVVGGLYVLGLARDFNSDGVPDLLGLDNTTLRIRFNNCTAQGSVTVGLASTPNPSTSGQSVTFTATVSATSGSGVPAGQVQFLDGSSHVSLVNISPPVSLTNGVATFTTSTLGGGNHDISAVYTGDANFSFASSPSVRQRVLPRLIIDDRTANSASDAAMVFTVRLTADISDAVSVDYSTSDRTAKAGTDYTATSGTLTFDPGQTSKTVSVPILPGSPGASKDFFLTLTNPTNATFAKSSAIGTIIYASSGALTLSIQDPSLKEGNTGTTLLGFFVTLSKSSATAVTIDYATADGTAVAGTDYTARSGTITFLPGKTSRAILISMTGNTSANGNRTLFVNLTNVTGGAQVAKSQGTGTILDDDPPTTASTVSQLRLYSPVTFEHLYTTDTNEYAVLATRGWSQEGTAYTMFQDAGLRGTAYGIPIYRLYHAGILQHHWTTDWYETTVLAAGAWDYEGIAGYVLPTQETGTIPLYRLSLASPPLHLWTTDANEKNVLSTQRGWVYEGILGYVIP
jgi:hypothetical protein